MGVLDGQIVLITGCARYRGMGRAMSRVLAVAGADLAITDIETSGTRNLGEQGEDEERIGWTGLGSLADEIKGIGRRAMTLLGDVSRRDDAERMVQQTLDQYGRIDVLINNAGAPQGADRNYLWEVPEEAFDLVMDVNAKGNYLMSAAVVRHMLARGGPGRIINIASVAGKVGYLKMAPYCASKFAVIGLTQSLAQELAPHGITVNAICPTAVDTARNQASRARRAASQDQETAATLQLTTNTPIGRIAQPDDIANLVLFFASPASEFITGQSVNVSGGLVMS